MDLIFMKLLWGGAGGDVVRGKAAEEEDEETSTLAQKLLNEGGVRDVLDVCRSHVENIVRHAQRRTESSESLRETRRKRVVHSI